MTTTEPLRVGVVGLGDIAQKAYLPALAARDDLELSLMTRDAERLGRLARRYQAARATTDLDDLLDGSLDAAFVHASTDAHAEIVTRLLDAGVHVLVDKPLAPRLEESTALVERAEAAGLSLMVGFNRRHCPAIAALQGLDLAVVLVEKHRAALPERPRRFVLDDFVHVVDTLRFLLPPGEPEVSVWCSGADGLLTTVTLTLRVGAATGIGVMHRVGGGEQESVEVLGAGVTRRVVDLAAVTGADVGTPGSRTTGPGGWTDVPTVRGFTAMVDAFVGAVRAGRVLSARDALLTHDVCETVVRAAEAELLTR